MPRPYFKKRIHELEEIFQGFDGDREVLRLLDEELSHRKTPRAVALRRRVGAGLEGKPGDVEVQHALPGIGRSAPEADDLGAETLMAAQESPASEAQDSRGHGGHEIRPPVSEETRPVARGGQAATSREPKSPDLSSPAENGSRSPFSPPEIQAPATDDLLAAWVALEVLEPQALPKPADLEASGRQMIRAHEHPEPWTDNRYGPRGRQREVHWFVYLGELNLSAATEALLDLFPDDSPEKPRPTKGTTTMAVVVLDQTGRPAEGKVFVSSFAWAYGKLHAGGGIAALAAFPEEERFLCQEIEQRLVRMDEEGEVLPASADDLARLTRWLMGRLGLPVEQVSLAPVFLRVPAWVRIYEAPEPELLNSFFLDDLAKVRSALRSGQVGPALMAFVTAEPARPRADVVRLPQVLEEAIEPGRIPMSRWPPRGRHALVMMQQAAVNHAVRELSDSGLVGVNGPPGTGKTTLLRDIVAKVVLDRAAAMAAFEDPVEAFIHVAPMAAGRGFLQVYRLDERLLGHEIVVASSNNKAVENVSREIPGLEAVAEDFEPPLRYFDSIADRVLGGEGRSGEGDTVAAWGLAAAVLGNAKNRRDFVDAFWWDGQRSMQSYLRGIAEGWNQEATTDRSAEGDEPKAPAEVLRLENAPGDRAEALTRWRGVRARFRAVLKEVESKRRDLETARRALQERAGVETAIETVRSEIGRLRGLLVERTRDRRDAEDRLKSARGRTVEAVSDREALQALRPGFFSRLFRTRRFHDWRGRMTVAVDEVEAARREERVAQETFQEARAAEDELESRLRKQEIAASRLEQKLGAIRSTLTSAQTQLGERLPDHHFWSRPEEERQKLSPWLGAHFQASRDDLFAASFELHRAFIDAAAPRLRHNLGAAMALLKGRKLSEKQEPARRSLWASLFLVVPVVSTTFASVSRMFGRLGREQLGWLLIDEAGQAVPQAAVGAMWRARRVIAIGDPMQIPPVVSMPQRLINAILAEHEVDPDAWAAPRSSVQSLADRASWFGTTLLTEEGDVWVGSPLRVHRRCDDPMFRISNQIAYDGLMVQATPAVSSPIGDILGESVWFHVEGAQPGHWCPTEGDLAARLLLELLNAGIRDPEIFFITPFRLVQVHLRKRLRQVITNRVSSPAWTWVNENVGTIHTFQGKEAEAVVLVLGAPSLEAAGARYWAGGTPNLLNVAASRAKRRLYVIGNRRAWREAGVFRTLAAHLPERTWG